MRDMGTDGFWLPDSVRRWLGICMDDGAGCLGVVGVLPGVARGVGCEGRL